MIRGGQTDKMSCSKVSKNPLCLFLLALFGISFYAFSPTSNTIRLVNQDIVNVYHSQRRENSPWIVHFVRLYKDGKAINQAGLCFLECLSLLSVMINKEFEWIYIHTNIPELWPFRPCENLSKSFNWNKVKLVDSPLVRKIGNVDISYIEHEADIKKLQAIIRYGGIAMDFDVYMINPVKLFGLLENHQCVASREENILNSGFLACNQESTRFAEQLLASYYSDYRPDQWVYNSGEKAMKIYLENQQRVYLDDTVDNQPPWVRRHEFLSNSGIHDWKHKLAHHSFFHDCKFSKYDLAESVSTFGEVLRWICDRGQVGLPDPLRSQTISPEQHVQMNFELEHREFSRNVVDIEF